MGKITVRVHPNGNLEFVDTPDAAGLKADGPVTTRRASHVEPARRVWRWLFHGLRRLFGEDGRVAEWTRGMRVYWRADMRPSGGPVLPVRSLDRAEVIAAEVEWLLVTGLGRHPDRYARHLLDNLEARLRQVLAAIEAGRDEFLPPEEAPPPPAGPAPPPVVRLLEAVGDEMPVSADRTLTAAEKAAYVRDGYGRCPYCLCPGRDSEELEATENTATASVTCLGCDREWTDVYTLTGIVPHDPNDPGVDPDRTPVDTGLTGEAHAQYLRDRGLEPPAPPPS